MAGVWDGNIFRARLIAIVCCLKIVVVGKARGAIACLGRAGFAGKEAILANISCIISYGSGRAICNAAEIKQVSSGA